MKHWFFLIVILALFLSCSSKKHIVKTHRVTTREFDTLVSIPGKRAEFIPIRKDSVERMVDIKTGIIVTHYYQDIAIPPSNDTTVVKQLFKETVETPDEDVKVKGKETDEVEQTVKKVEGIPWYYQYSLYIVLTIVVIIIIRIIIKSIFPVKI